MIVRELISDTIPSVNSADPIGRALDWMGEFKLSQLPIVDNGKYEGIITENDILDAEEFNISVGEMRYTGWDTAYIHHGNHVYDAMDIMSNLKLEVLPVLDEEEAYLGVITLRDLSTYLGKLFAVQEQGGVLVVSVPHNGYSLSEIGRIVESADARVLSLYLSSVPGVSELLITLKLNVEDLSRVVATFERFEYNVVRTYHRVAHAEDYRRNLDALIKYLDI